MTKISESNRKYLEKHIIGSEQIPMKTQRLWVGGIMVIRLVEWQIGLFSHFITRKSSIWRFLLSLFFENNDKRTTLVDNNTWNNSHIAMVGKAMASNEDDAYTIMQELGVDYVLVIFGGLLGNFDHCVELGSS